MDMEDIYEYHDDGSVCGNDELGCACELCVACGEPPDYCQGHGEIGDPAGYARLQAHDAGDHSQCDLSACADASLELEALTVPYTEYPVGWCGD